MSQSEAALEQELIEQLQALGFAYVSIKSIGVSRTLKNALRF